MSLDRRAAESPRIGGVADLAAWFRARERPVSEWKVGIEHEKIALLAGTTEAVPYDGPRGIAALLRGFGRFGYEPFEEDGRIIASQHGGLTVSIEPGGQLELSGRPFKDVHVVAAELDRHLAKCRAIATELGVELLAVGYRPWGTPGGVPWMPKSRYLVMRPFLAARGRLAPDMMAMTGSTQASFDFSSERDMAEKVRVALAAQPAVTALYANSPIVAGRDSGFQSYRAEVWREVDPSRCGILPFAFEPGFEEDAYRRYAEWALDVPMVFLRREGKYLETGGKTFRTFLGEGLEGHAARMSDWEDHLSALFPDVRVKGVVEVRGADACDPALVKALAALWKGILYSRESRDWAFDLVRGLTLPQRHELAAAAARDGLRARTPDGRTLRQVAKGLVDAAELGLCRQNACGEGGQDERVWLRPLAERIDSGRSPADDARDAFRRGDRALAEHLRIA